MPLHLQRCKTRTWQENRKKDGLSLNWHEENELGLITFTEEITAKALESQDAPVQPFDCTIPKTTGETCQQNKYKKILWPGTQRLSTYKCLLLCSH